MWHVMHCSFKKQLSAFERQRAFRPEIQPLLIIGRVHDVHLAPHAGVVRAAILRAEEVVLADDGWRKPRINVTAGNDVDFRAKGGHEEIVNYIFRSERELDRLGRAGRAAR